MLSDFKTVAGGVTFSKPKFLILCPLDGSVIDPTNAVFGSDYLASHSRQPVNILNAFLTARSQQIITDTTSILELGPHPAISGMVRPTLGSQITCLASSHRGRPIWNVLSTTLKSFYTMGANISWAEYQRDFQASHTVLPLPSYSWDLKEYWIPYVNDWSLRKGDPPLVISNALGLETTTIHKVVEETSNSQSAHLIVQADIAREDLSPLVQGHEVDGIPLCTPSVYADMALSLGTYLIRRYQPTQEDDFVDVSDMSISKALILKADATQQLLQAHVDVDWSSRSAAIKFMSFDVCTQHHFCSHELSLTNKEQGETPRTRPMRGPIHGQKSSTGPPEQHVNIQAENASSSRWHCRGKNSTLQPTNGLPRHSTPGQVPRRLPRH